MAREELSKIAATDDLHISPLLALTVLGKVYVFPNKIDGLPAKLSDFKDLQINEARLLGSRLGKAAHFCSRRVRKRSELHQCAYLLSKQYHVYVLDERNQGLSQKADSGNRIYR